MKMFIGLFMVLCPLMSSATKIVGNGGDFRALEFVETAYQVVGILELEPIPGVDLEQLKSMIREAVVESTEEKLFLDGKEKDAINYPSLKTIIFNRQAWYSRNEDARPSFVLHEYLGLMGVDDSTYQFSRLLTGSVVSVKGADAAILMEIFAENGILSHQVIQVTCEQTRNTSTVLAYKCYLGDSLTVSGLRTIYARQARELWALLQQFRRAECESNVCWVNLLTIRCSARRMGSLWVPLCRILRN